MLLWLSILSGVVATLLFAYVVIGISRIQSLTSALGITRVFKFHKWAGIIVLVAVVLHIVLLMVDDPVNLELLNPIGGTTASKSAMAATGALLAIFSIARWRGTYYVAWRWVHLFLAVVSVTGIALHLLLLGHHYALWVIVVVVIVVMLIRRWLWAPLRGRKYRVVDVRPEHDGVATVILSPHRKSRHGKTEKLSFRPGQFSWIRLQRLFATEEHPYTMASGSEANTIEFTVKYTPDSFSDKFAHLNVGKQVYLDGPYGDFTPYHRDLVMIAAGVGITPMMSMLRTLAEKEDTRRMMLIYVGKRLLFKTEIQDLERRLNLKVFPMVGRPINASTLASILPRQRRHFDYYVCGSERLIKDALGALHTLKVPTSRVHTEQFSSPKGRIDAIPTTNRPRSRDDFGNLRRDGRDRHSSARS